MVLSHIQYNGLDSIHLYLHVAGFCMECIFRIDILYVIKYVSQIGCMSSARLRLLLLGANHVCSPYSAQFSCKSFVIIQISSLVTFPDSFVYTVVIKGTNFIT
jgi:hypothetical protein